MDQSRRNSLLETSLNTATGFIVSMVVWRFIAAPYLGVPVSMETNLVVTSIFTVTSVVRGYIWRRVFNNVQRKLWELKNQEVKPCP